MSNYILFGTDTNGENITELMISEGWLSVRPESARMDPALAALEEQAKSSKKVCFMMALKHGSRQKLVLNN